MIYMGIEIALTEEIALRICRLLWIWMYEEKTPCACHKGNWPGWEKYGLMGNDCPCCQYEGEKDRNPSCRDMCILKSVWPKGCIYGDSPFGAFSCGEGTPEDALKIVRGCEAALDKLGKYSPIYKPRDNKATNNA